MLISFKSINKDKPPTNLRGGNQALCLKLLNLKVGSFSNITIN